MRGGRRPAEWAVFYSKPPSPICNRDLHNGRRPFTIVSRVLHFAESRPGGARRRAAPGDPQGGRSITVEGAETQLPAIGVDGDQVLAEERVAEDLVDSGARVVQDDGHLAQH